MARAAPESRQQARTIAYSLARALRALAGDLSWERLGRVALLENASEILPKSLPEASRDLPELIVALLGVVWSLLGPPPQAPGASLGRCCPPGVLRGFEVLKGVSQDSPGSPQTPPGTCHPKTVEAVFCWNPPGPRNFEALDPPKILLG